MANGNNDFHDFIGDDPPMSRSQLSQILHNQAGFVTIRAVVTSATVFLGLNAIVVAFLLYIISDLNAEIRSLLEFTNNRADSIEETLRDIKEEQKEIGMCFTRQERND